MPSDTTRTATDAAPAVKVGDKVRARVCSNWYGRAGKIIAVRGRFIVVKWSSEPQPMVYILNSNDSFDFHDCCEVCPADVVKPSRRALREQLQQERTAREAAEGAAERAEQQWRIHAASEQEQRQRADAAGALLQQAEAERDALSASLKVTGHALEQAIAEREQERDAHAQTKAALLDQRWDLDAAQQELQQARGLIGELRGAVHFMDVRPLYRDLLARADAFLAGTKAVESAQELAQHTERT